jgi:D-proline reductase (dithiol) PrdB
MSGPVQYIESVTERYKSLGYAPYRWYRADEPPPFRRLSKPLQAARIGLLSTAGAYAVGQVAYHYKDDTSTREIASSTRDEDLRFSHVTENYLVDPRRDPGCVLPLAALRKLADEKFIGQLAEKAYSCMGGVYSQRRVREELAPALLNAYKAQEVDAVLLVPMCPVCHQSVGLIARHLEANGIPTMCLGSAHDILAAGRPPRATFVDYPLGHTSGKPFDPADQLGIVREALRGLETATEPGKIRLLPNQWDASGEWKKQASHNHGLDTRRPRDESPQFQEPSDRDAARASGAFL